LDGAEEGRGDECDNEVGDPVDEGGERHAFCACTEEEDLSAEKPWNEILSTKIMSGSVEKEEKMSTYMAPKMNR
jgi:hypothetical protein